MKPDFIISGGTKVRLVTDEHRKNEPTPLELAQNFSQALAVWSAAGYPLVDRAGYIARAAACEACELWDGAARLGLGTCKAPGCGCTKFKRWLATERCKHPQGSRWPAVP